MFVHRSVVKAIYLVELHVHLAGTGLVLCRQRDFDCPLHSLTTEGLCQGDGLLHLLTVHLNRHPDIGNRLHTTVTNGEGNGIGLTHLRRRRVIGLRIDHH